MLNVDIDSKAEEFILTLPIKRQKQIVAKIDALAVGSKAGIKSLKEFPLLSRLRSGDYRIIYYTDDNTLYIVLVDLRSRIYKRLKQILK
jgi:mRNA-degrading endonuclease RelE of RelBE toxin-antitoxin system